MKRVVCCLPILSLMVILGCGGPSDKYKVVQVKGLVTLDGQPVEGASVMFLPQSAEGAAAAATTGADGRYTLQTAGATRPGAVPGSYNVTIIKQVVTETGSDGKAVPKGMQVASPTPTTQSKNHLPAKYGNPTQSGFTATVSESGANTFDFDLKNK